MSALENKADSKTLFGFWVYLMTDVVLFATLFASFIVLRNSTFGGPAGEEIFSLPYVLVETFVLLASSFTAGLALLSAYKHKIRHVLYWLTATFSLGLAFLALEINEFLHLYHEGHDWTASAFLSAFFTLVGTHGLHICAGLMWMIVIIQQILDRGLVKPVLRRLTMFSLFWHFLDIVWIFIFTVVFLMGAIDV